MSLLWIDGFDELPEDGEATTYLPTAGYLGTAYADASTGRGETGKCLSLGMNGILYKTFPQRNAGSTLTIGFGFRYTGGLAASDIATLNGPFTNQIVIFRNASNGLVVTVNGTDTFTTDNEVIQGNVWAYLEFMFIWDAVEPKVIVRVNNIQLINEDSPALTGTSPDRLALVNTATGNHLYDDLYIGDATGISNTSFLGDIYVENAYIESNADSAEWTPMGSVSNFLNINDTGLANESRFNASDELGARDVFNPRDLSVSGDQLFAVQIGLRVRKVGSGDLSVTSLALLGYSEVSSPANYPDASYQTFHNLLNLDPAGAVWTVEAFNAMRVGYELTY